MLRSLYDSHIMEDFNAQQSSDDVKKLMKQLRAENVALRDENATLQQQCVTLGQQFAAAESARAHAQAELSTLTDAAQVLQEDREQLRNKIAELQAAVDRLTNMRGDAAARSGSTARISRPSLTCS